VKLPFATRVRLAAVASWLAVAGAAAAASVWLQSPWLILAVALAVGLPLGWWILDRILSPVSQVLRALRDGVQGFRDHDFSLHLAVDRKDELGELVELYNSMGDVLRDERSAILQREMLLSSVFELTPMAIVLTNAADRIVFANRSAREMFAVKGRLEGLVFGQILAECPPVLREALEGGRDSLFSLERGGEEEVYHVARRAFELNGQRHDLTLVNA
jgi:two-component system nitrogen regulation sensor histidine kinase NtrY